MLERLPTQTEEWSSFFVIAEFVASSIPHDQTTNILAIETYHITIIAFIELETGTLHCQTSLPLTLIIIVF